MIVGQIVNGLVIGCMYALIALGFTLVLGSLHKLNLAHSDIMMCGGFVGVAMTSIGLPLWLGLIGAMIIGGLLGILVNEISFRRVGSEDQEVASALSSVAVGLVLTDLVQKVWGTEPVPLQMPLSGPAIEIADVRFTTIQLSVVVIAIALMIGLNYLVRSTSLGRQIRAVADHTSHAALMGVDVRNVTRAVFFLSSGLAATAGFLIAARLGTASSDIGFGYGLKSLAIMAIGGMGDLRGAVLGGLLIGVLESLAVNYGLGRLTDLLVWVCLIVVLVVRPQGILGAKQHEARA